MLTLQVIACIGIITGAFLLFQIRLNDFTGNISTGFWTHRKESVRRYWRKPSAGKNPISAGRSRKYRKF